MIGFFISEAFIGMNRSRLMSVITIATITVSLIVFGIFLLLNQNLNNLTSLMASKMELRIFLKDSLTKQEIREFEIRLKKINGLKDLNYVPREEAWKSFKKNFKTLELEKNMKNNPLPNAYSLKMEEEKSILPIAEYIKSFDYFVEDVVYGGEVAKRIEMFSHTAKMGGSILVLLLAVSTLLIIINTIRLTVIARQEEITIMHLVGATDPFIRWPFIIEGLFMGSIGAILAISLLSIGLVSGVKSLHESLPFLPLLFEPSQLMGIYITVGSVGTLMGVIGAYISVTKTLKQQQYKE